MLVWGKNSSGLASWEERAMSASTAPAISCKFVCIRDLPHAGQKCQEPWIRFLKKLIASRRLRITTVKDCSRTVILWNPVKNHNVRYVDPYLLWTSPSTFPHRPPLHNTESSLKMTFIRPMASWASKSDEPRRARDPPGHAFGWGLSGAHTNPSTPGSFFTV